MNILQILPELNVGGVETGTMDFAKYLGRHGHGSVVVSNGGGLVRELQEGGCTHYALPVHQKNIFIAFGCVRRLADIIRKEHIDIVHARSRVPAWIAYFACRRTDAVFITTCHGYYAVHLFSRVMGWGKMVIAVSQVIGRHMVADFGVPSEFIRVIAPSVDTAKFTNPRTMPKDPQTPVITMVGRITPLKGHAYFLKAMARVARVFPKAKIQIIGDAPAKKTAYRQELLLLTKRLGLSANVSFLGNRRDIPQLLAQSDCLVLATVTQEAFGRVVLEAQAAGVPVVATRVGGVVEIIDHEKTGLLVLPKDDQDMARAVIRILRDDALAENMTAAAKIKIEQHYTLARMAEATLEVYREVLGVTRILVVKLSALGDVVLTTGSLKALRQKFPNADLQCLTSPDGAAVLQHCPYLNDIIVFDPRNKGLAGIWDLGRVLRKRRFDKVVDLQNNRTSHVLSFLSMAPQTCGYDNGKFGFLLNRRIKDDLRGLAPVEHQFRVLGLLGLAYDPGVFLELWPSDRDREYVRSLLESEWLGNVQDFIGLNLAASAQWPTKNWPPGHMAKLCDLLAGQNIRVVLTGQDKDRPLARWVINRTKAKPANLVGKTNILQLAALLGRCRVYVSPDSAPLHVASAMKVPIVALFGPTDPRRHMPPGNAIVLKRDLKCSPCYSGRCKIRTHACMEDITPEEVFRKIKELMKT